MPRIKIRNEDLAKDLTSGIPLFPKYTTQLMNLANQNAQGTRPKIVGQMTELIQEFPGKSFDEWVFWYNNKKPNAIDEATDKIFTMIENLRSALNIIDLDMVKKWVTDLVINKTYIGLKFQESILKRIAYKKNTTYQLSTPIEESKGIDGFIGGKPVSIKPTTYKYKQMLMENIDVDLIYYDKKKDGISVEYK